VGLFKFALPTFSQGDLSSWEEGEGRLTVPRPPSHARKNAVRDDTKELVGVDNVDTRSIGREDSKQQSKASIAYVVIIPSHDDTTNSSLRERAAVLSASVKRAHMNSPHEYQLYAINYEHPSSTDIEKSYICSRTCREMMNQLDYRIVDLSTSDLDSAIRNKRGNIEGDVLYQQSLNELLSNVVVMHIALGSFLLKPMDSVINELLNDESNEMGLASYEAPSNGLLRKKATQKKELLTMQAASPHETASGSQLHIIKTISNEATVAYLELLKCKSSQQFGNSNQQTSIASDGTMEEGDVEQPIIFPKIRSLLASAVKHTDIQSPRQDYGDQCAISSKFEILDGCMYAAGSHQPCSHIDTKSMAIVAAFVNNVCMKPWECKRNENNWCINRNSGISVNADCEWLQNEWFRLVNSL
jgi:hypothetical protein